MSNRLKEHPILDILDREKISFYWNKNKFTAYQGDMISSALISEDIYIFGHLEKDHKAQGIFCANGQCAKCMVIANGVPVKACMTAVTENMIIESADGLPELPVTDEVFDFKPIKTIKTDVLIIGGGPSGLSAAIELNKNKIDTILIDDKNDLGGKLVLQTHKFFGSVEDSYAGTRGIDIGKKLSDNVISSKHIDIWTNSTALYVFKDKKVGILKEKNYILVEPKIILNAAGAREKFLRFSGNDLVGIYGAGAFQTLVNRDLIKSSKRLFIVGGGNVGLIAGYHALQAGIEVVGLVEAMPSCGGYKVHADKLKRLGVPIYTSHSILSANGKDQVESITIVKIDEKFKPIQNTEKSFSCDTILIAVGLDSLSEFTREAETSGIKVYATGDALEIAEASSAMFNGKIMGLLISKELGADIGDIPEEWYQKADILKSHPGRVLGYSMKMENGKWRMENVGDGLIRPESVAAELTSVPISKKMIFPVIHCLQEIPCNPCTTICPTNSIIIKTDSIMGQPVYEGSCIGCGKCLYICPGLAISLVEIPSLDIDEAIVSLPYEIFNHKISIGDELEIVDINGDSLGVSKVFDIKTNPQTKTQMIKFKMPIDKALKAISFVIQKEEVSKPLPKPILPENIDNNTMICLCERVSVETVKALIKKGIRDINQMKALTRMCMGPCGAKNCDILLKQVFRQEGISIDNITENTRRPLFIEVPLDYITGKD